MPSRKKGKKPKVRSQEFWVGRAAGRRFLMAPQRGEIVTFNDCVFDAIRGRGHLLRSHRVRIHAFTYIINQEPQKGGRIGQVKTTR